MKHTHFVLNYITTPRAQGMNPDGKMWQITRHEQTHKPGDLIGYALTWEATGARVESTRFSGMVRVWAETFEVDHDKLAVRFSSAPSDGQARLPETDDAGVVEGAAK